MLGKENPDEVDAGLDNETLVASELPPIVVELFRAESNPLLADVAAGTTEELDAVRDTEEAIDAIEKSTADGTVVVTFSP